MRFAFERAGFVIRAIASLVDWIVVIVPIGIMIYLFTGEASFNWTQGLVWNIVYYFYLVITPVFWKGYVIGKKIMNIKIEKVNGTKLTLLDMFIREVIGIFLLGVVTFGLSTVIGGLMVLFRQDKRGIHDLLSGTFVKAE